MKNELFERKTLTAAMGTVAIGLAMGSAPAFAATDLGTGYQAQSQGGLMLAGHHAEGKCGAAEEKSSEGSCGEGKCGAAEEKSSEGSCGEGKCGAVEEKSSEGSCGEGKCGSR
ncbi:MAG: hypothetical protein ACK4IT_03150 [Thioalkalivibrionaceae bacterium]